MTTLSDHSVWKPGDRVALPACDNATGTVRCCNTVTGYTEVVYDDEPDKIEACDASDLVRITES